MIQNNDNRLEEFRLNETMHIVKEGCSCLPYLNKVISKGWGGKFLHYKYLLAVIIMRYITIYIS